MATKNKESPSPGLLDALTNATPEQVQKKAVSFVLVFVGFYFFVRELNMAFFLALALFLAAYIAKKQVNYEYAKKQTPKNDKEI